MRRVEISRCNTKMCEWCSNPSKVAVEAIGINGRIALVYTCWQHIQDAFEYVTRAPSRGEL